MSVKIHNDKGDIIIQNTVITRIAATVAMGCYGVVGMAMRNKTGMARLLLGNSEAKGVKLTVNNNSINIDLHIISEYGVNIRAVSESIRNNVKYQVESITGYPVNAVNVNIESVRVDE